MPRIRADTNIWLRIADAGAPQHPAAVEAVARLLRDEIEVCLCPQNLVEFWVVATRPVTANGLGWATEAAAAEISGLERRFTLLPETPELFLEWKRLVQSAGITGKRAHDARIAAVCFSHRLDALITFNAAGFSGCAPLRLLHPDLPDAWHLALG